MHCRPPGNQYLFCKPSTFIHHIFKSSKVYSISKWSLGKYATHVLIKLSPISDYLACDWFTCNSDELETGGLLGMVIVLCHVESLMSPAT